MTHPRTERFAFLDALENWYRTQKNLEQANETEQQLLKLRLSTAEQNLSDSLDRLIQFHVKEILKKDTQNFNRRR